jgi:hypothetical protein
MGYKLQVARRVVKEGALFLLLLLSFSNKFEKDGMGVD